MGFGGGADERCGEAPCYADEEEAEDVVCYWRCWDGFAWNVDAWDGGLSCCRKLGRDHGRDERGNIDVRHGVMCKGSCR